MHYALAFWLVIAAILYAMSQVDDAPICEAGGNAAPARDIVGRGDAVASAEENSETFIDSRGKLPNDIALDWYFRTIFAEVGRQDDAEILAVAHVILNRWLSGRYGETLGDVVTADEQFSVWNADDPQHAVVEMPQRKLQRFAQYRHVRSLAFRALESRLIGGADPTNGCLFYYHPAAMRPAGRVPEWAAGLTATQVGALRCLPRARRAN